MSGYLNACLKELASRRDVEVLVVHETTGDDAPFEDSQFGWIPQRMTYVSRPDRRLLLERVRRFEPDAIFVSSWHIKDFRFVLRRIRHSATRVLCMDNQWRGTPRQWLGVGVSRWYLRGLYDAVFVPGERQACFAQRLGFRAEEIFHGLLCPDAAAIAGHRATAPRPHNFGFLGRLSYEKGILDLLSGYEIYRRGSKDPWGLTVAGAGVFETQVRSYSDIRYVGFVQPNAVGTWFEEIGCLVVPSRSEAWGVAISEGAVAGLPIIATDACGAVPHLVHDLANGRIARTGNRQSIADCMDSVARMDDHRRAEMGRVSQGLVRPYSVARWADTVLEIAGRSVLRTSSR
jgi:glycosyltransferase involved in cell wall biosynthesis